MIVESTASGSLVDGCRFLGVAASGTVVNAPRTKVTGCMFQHCGFGFTGADHGVRHRRYAVATSGGSGMTVTGTRWRSLGTGGTARRAG